MDTTPSYEEGHLLVAAVRLLAHRDRRPPTIEDVARETGQPPEMCGHLARSLASLGIVKLLKNPFDARVEILDHLRLEKLPRGERPPAIEGEIQEFRRKFEREREEMQEKLLGKVHEKKARDRITGMEKKLSSFRPRGIPPGGGPAGGEAEDED
jgi:hypothetical protein